MKTTRIAGLCFDPRQARSVRQTARIYTYARRIRQLATDAQDITAEPAPSLPPTRIVIPSAPRTSLRLPSSV